MSRKRAGLKLIGVPVEPDLHAAIVELSQDLSPDKPLPLAAVCRELLRKAIEEGWDKLVARDLKDAGYQEGLRRGLHEAKTKLTGALKGSW